MGGRALAEPVLEHRVGEATELDRLFVAGRHLVVGAGQPHRRDRRRLGLDAEVGEHVAHQRLVDQLGAEGGTVGGVIERLDDAGAVAGGGADHAVEPGVVDHLDDRRHAAALLADHPRPGAAELDLAGGVGAVAELVLEPLDVEARCARRRGSSAASGSRRCRSRSGRGRGRRRTSAPSRTTCGRAARTRRPARRRSAASPWSCWRGRRSRPASRSSPSRRARPLLRSAGIERSS